MKDIIPELNDKSYIFDLQKTYDIRFCKISEYCELVDFIKKYWKEDHIFVKSKELLDFQHLDKENRRYNFVIAKNKKTQEIHSILGFIPSSQFDRYIKHMMIWPAIWKSRDDINVKGLGVSLYFYLKENLPIENISILGISEIALSIYKHWNFETGKIEHYFFPNNSIKDFNLLKNFCLGKYLQNRIEEDSMLLSPLELDEYCCLDIENPVFKELSIYKSKNYYINRFYKHPIYKYNAYSISMSKEYYAILFTRECSNGNNKCIRIVDYIGNISYLKNVSNQIQELLKANNCEYIDFLEVGQNQNLLKEACFIDANKEKDLIIPNYFEPFLLKTINLDYAFRTTNNDKAVFFKADSDQDRPNMLF